MAPSRARCAEIIAKFPNRDRVVANGRKWVSSMWREDELMEADGAQKSSAKALNAADAQKTRAPQGWRVGSIKLFSPSTYGVKMAPESRLSQWHGDQDGALCFPSTQARATRHISTSATGEEQHRRTLREFSKTDSHPNQTEEEDLDYYMKLRYNEENLRNPEAESEEEPLQTKQLEEEPLRTEQVEEDLLWKLKPNSEGKFDNVITVLADPQVLAAAHERLNERRRNWTLASNDLEVSHVPKENRMLRSGEIDWNWFKEAGHLLRTEKYGFKPPKRLDIARRLRGEPKQWVFVTPKDQVIQEAMRLILSRIYAPLFSLHDSGVAPGGNVHAALKSVKYGWKGISWFLRFDVRVADHPSVQTKLLEILSEQIDDDAFLGALRRMFELGTVWVESGNGGDDVPEGSVLSPVLGDIYFHQLDLEMGRIKEDIRCGNQR